MKPNAIKITNDDGNLRVKSPYNPSFVKDARTLGGRWNPSGGVWIFDSRTEDRVRELLKTTYGTDQTEYRSATIRLDVGAWWREETTGDSATCYFGGRMILSRKFRDSRVILGEGVILVDGGFPGRGGSTLYPSLDLESGKTFIEVYDIPTDHPDIKSGSSAITIVAEETIPDPMAEFQLRSSTGNYGSTISAEDLAQALEIALVLRPDRMVIFTAQVTIKQLDGETTTQESTESGYICISTMGVKTPIEISVEQNESPEWQIGSESGDVDPIEIPTLFLDQAGAKALLDSLA